MCVCVCVCVCVSKCVCVCAQFARPSQGKHRKYDLVVGCCYPAGATKRREHLTTTLCFQCFAFLRLPENNIQQKVHIFDAFFLSSRSEARSNKSSYFRCFPWFGRGHTAPDCTGQSVENMIFLLDLLSAGFVNLLP